MNDIIKALNWRYAVRVFDPAKKVSDEDVQIILESGRLAPSSYGVEPWRFIVVKNPEVRVQLRAASYDQPKVTDASHLIVIARRTDARTALTPELVDRTAKAQGVDVSALEGLKNMVDGFIAHQTDTDLDAWVMGQVHIPLGIMVTTAAQLGVDSGPMGGFIPAEVDAILDLPSQNLTSTVMLALGYRGEDPSAARPKVRRAFEDAVSIVE